MLTTVIKETTTNKLNIPTDLKKDLVHFVRNIAIKDIGTLYLIEAKVFSRGR